MERASVEKYDPVTAQAYPPNESDEKLGDSSTLEWDDEEEKRIRNKLDWHIVPVVTVLYLLCFIDR